MSVPVRRLYIASYDVANAKRLKTALHVTRRYATGGQKSVHEVWLTAAEKGELLLEMALLLEPSEDSFLLVRLDPRQTVYTLGVGIPPGQPDWFYLG